MSEEERLSLNNYMADLYQAMQIGDIVFEAKHSSELYNLINKLLEENKKYKEVIDKISKIIYEIDESIKTTGGYPSDYIDDLLSILKEVE